MSLNRRAQQGVWSSVWIFTATALGAVVGLGNIWRFPHLVSENGGATFIFAYLVCALFIVVPLFVAEMVMGSRGRADPITTVKHLCLESHADNFWRPIGWLGCVISVCLLAFYMLITSWSAHYGLAMLRGEFTAVDIYYSATQFEFLLGDITAMLKPQLFIVFLLILAIVPGIRNGLARVSIVLMPLVFLGLIALLFFSFQYGSIDFAIAELFTLAINDLTAEAWLLALQQAFYTLVVGAGVVMVLGSYFPDGYSIPQAVLLVVVLDVAISIVFGVVIYSIVLDHSIEPGQGPSLVFISIPYALSNMVNGDFAGVAFFFIMSAVLFTSAIALAEPLTAWLCQRFRMHRALAALVTCAFAAGLAVLLTVLLGQDSPPEILTGLSYFVVIDLVLNQILLPLSGFFIAVFVGWILPKRYSRDELPFERERFFWLWHSVVRYIVPPMMLLVMGSSLYFRLNSGG